MVKIDTSDLLTVRNFAAMIEGRFGRGVSTQRVYAMEKEGKLKPILIDGIKFYRKSDLDKINTDKQV